MKRNASVLLVSCLVLVAACSDGQAEESGVEDPEVTAVAPVLSHESATSSPVQEVDNATSTDSGSAEANVQEPVLNDYVGMEYDQVFDEIAATGIRIDKNEVESTTHPPGTVISQMPGVGEPFPTEIRLDVAILPASVPDVVGQNYGEAREVIEERGFDVHLVEELSEEERDGVVLTQEPAAGAENVSVVEVTVARAPVVYRLMDVYLGAKSYWELRSGESYDADGETYSRGVRVVFSGTRPAEHEFNLSRNFRIIDGVIGLEDSSDGDGTIKLELVGDGRVLYEATVRFGETIPVEANVTDVLRLELFATPNTEDVALILGDWRIMGLESEVGVPGAVE